MEKPCTPMFDKMLNLKSEIEMCEKFFDFLMEKENLKNENKTKLVAEFLGIDLEKAEVERGMIVSSIKGGDIK